MKQKSKNKNNKNQDRSSGNKADSGKYFEKGEKVTCPVFINRQFLNLDPPFFSDVQFHIKIF
jgi:hypothetical protein